MNSKYEDGNTIYCSPSPTKCRYVHVSLGDSVFNSRTGLLLVDYKRSDPEPSWNAWSKPNSDLLEVPWYTLNNVRSSGLRAQLKSRGGSRGSLQRTAWVGLAAICLPSLAYFACRCDVGACGSFRADGWACTRRYYEWLLVMLQYSTQPSMFTWATACVCAHIFQRNILPPRTRSRRQLIRLDVLAGGQGQADIKLTPDCPESEQLRHTAAF
jgi:hypothetical protein